jgi:hypothetical protein
MYLGVKAGVEKVGASHRITTTKREDRSPNSSATQQYLSMLFQNRSFKEITKPYMNAVRL